MKSYQTRTICSTTCAVREVGSINEYGKLIKKENGELKIARLDLCPDCNTQSKSTIVGEKSEMFTDNLYFSFIEQEDD